jgi:hypothetical protein
MKRTRAHTSIEEPKILYSAGEVNDCIRRLFSEPDILTKRVIIVAYIGQDATEFLPSPEGVRIICSPSPIATSFKGIKGLQRRGAIVEFSKGLHQKIYWAQGRGCVISSANLSHSALGIGGLKEVGILLKDSEVDIDRLIRAAHPRAPSNYELNRLRRSEESAKFLNRKLGLTGFEQTDTDFSQWYLDPDRLIWKLGWWDTNAVASREAKRKSKLEYGVDDPTEYINVAHGTVSKRDWILLTRIKGKTATDIRWMFAEHIVPVQKDEKEVFEPDYPYQALQPVSLRRYPSPPFLLSRLFKSALRKSIANFGTEELMLRKSLVPPKIILDETHRRLSGDN